MMKAAYQMSTGGNFPIVQKHQQRSIVFQVPGNFHVATHSADKQPDSYDFAHEIHELSFGSKIKRISSKGIGSFNSLGGREKLDSNGNNIQYSNTPSFV